VVQSRDVVTQNLGVDKVIFGEVKNKYGGMTTCMWLMDTQINLMVPPL